MKKFLKSAGLPIGVFALAIGSAFATNVMKNTLSIPAYQKIDSQGLTCTPRTVSCDTSFGEACTWIEGTEEHDLYGMRFNPELNQTVCTLPLYKVQN